MSVCGHCGLPLAEGAVSCESCGTEVAAAKPATPKWGTLQISKPRPGSGPVALTLGDRTPPPSAAGGSFEIAKPQADAPPAVKTAGAARAAPAAPRAASRPLSSPLTPGAAAAQRPARTGSRPLSGALGPEAVAAARHPAARGNATPRAGVARHASAPLGHGAPARPPSRALSQPLNVPAATEPENTNHLATGMLDMDDRFGGAFEAGPALEMASIQPRRPEEPTRAPRPQQRPQPQQPKQQPQPEAPAESPAEQRQRRVRDLARYDPPPAKLLASVAYFLRVYSRRRELQAQVAQLTQQRKRLDQTREEALAALGQALYRKRNDPALQPLAAQLRVVSETAQEVGAKAAATKRNEQELKQDLAVLEREISELQTRAAPVQARERALQQTLDAHRAEIRRLELLVRKADTELKTLKTSAEAEVLKQIVALEAQRNEHYGETQSLQIQVLPLEDDLVGARAEAAKFSVMLDGLNERKQRLLGAMEREQGRGQIASGGVQAAYRDALRSVANGALRLEVAHLAPDEKRAVTETSEHAAARRESEELMRAAVASYDVATYQRGMQLLVGAILATFVLFVALIVF